MACYLFMKGSGKIKFYCILYNRNCKEIVSAICSGYTGIIHMHDPGCECQSSCHRGSVVPGPPALQSLSGVEQLPLLPTLKKHLGGQSSINNAADEAAIRQLVRNQET